MFRHTYTRTRTHSVITGQFLTKAFGFLVSLSSADIEHFSEDDEEEMERELIATSPEPPEPVEPEDTTQTDENSQPGRLHPEQDLPYIFKVGDV